MAALGERDAHARLVPVVPSGLDQQAAHVTVPGAGDAAATRLRAAAVLARHQPEVGHQLAGGAEAPKVVQLGQQGDGGDRVDASEAAQPADGRGVARLASQILEVQLERSPPGLRLLHGQQIVFEHHTLRGALKRLLTQPPPVGLRPGALGAVPEHPSPSQQELAQPVPCPHQIQAYVIAPAAQVAHRLFVLTRGIDHRQQPRTRQLGQLAGIATIRLDSLARSDRDHRRRHHITHETELLQLTLQRVAARAGLIDAVDRAPSLPLEPPRHATHRAGLVCNPPLHGGAAGRDQHRHDDVLLVNVQTDERARLVHRPAPFFVCGSGAARP